MKKKLLIILGLMPFVNLVLGQEIPIDIIERINNVNYIFGGEVISSEPYYSNNGHYIRTSNTVSITKRLKGEIECGTIEIITNGGTLNSATLEISHSLELAVGSRGIFLCNDTQRPISTIDFYPETNPEILEATYENQSFIRYWWNGQAINAADMWNNYDSLALVYNATEAITGLQYVDCTSSITGVNTSGGNQSSDYLVAIADNFEFPQYSQSKFDSLIAYADLKRRNYSRYERANEKIFYEIENVEVTGTAFKFLEFDVTVKDDYGLGYLDLAAVRIEYNALLFGSDVVDNGNIAVTRGTLNIDTNCYQDPTPSDVGTGNTVLITAFETTFSQCKAPITTTAQSLIHVKMQFLTCNFESEIALVDTVTFLTPSLMLLYSAFADFPADTLSTYYSNIEHDQVSFVPKCKVTIDDFTPKTINGGTGEVLTITGYNFGATQGTGAIYFPNANDGGLTKLRTNDNWAIINWTDTLIQLYMPSYDSTVLGGTNSFAKPAGTGTFKVYSENFEFDETDDTLKVHYSIKNNKTKEPVFLAPHTSFNGTYTFHCDTAVANYSGGPMKAVIKKALADWACLTGVDWKMGADTAFTNPVSGIDSICIIRFSVPTDSMASNAIASASLTHLNYGTVGSPLLSLGKEIDIKLNSNFDFFCDTTGLPIPPNKKDLYSVILHELGHGHGLNHVIDANAIMHFQYTGVKNDLANNLSANDGGDYLMLRSTLLTNVQLNNNGSSRINSVACATN